MTYATVQRDGHREHWRIKSSGFRQWLGKQFYDAEGTVVGARTLQDVLNVLEAKARFEGACRPCHLRVGEAKGQKGQIYLDLGDASWRAVEIDRSGWRVVDNPPVRFRRPKGMLALPLPVPGSITDLRRFVNVDDEQWTLLLPCLVAALRPSSTYPIVVINGEQGSAKSTSQKMHRRLIDPNTAPVRRAPGTERDLMVAASNSWAVSFDNISYLTPEMSDALCMLATGGGLSVRMNYTDDEEQLFNASRPIVINGIGEVATRDDFLDRAVILHLPTIEEKQRKTEGELWAEFEQAYPSILGGLLTALSAALAKLPVEKPERGWPRMADFCELAIATERGLGLEACFLDAYEDNRRTAGQSSVDASVLMKPLKAVLGASGVFEGFAADLLERLNEIATDQQKRGKDWPQNARSLGSKLTRLAPSLRKVEWEVAERKKDGKTRWSIRMPPKGTA
jgi:hypothetical protein